MKKLVQLACVIAVVVILTTSARAESGKPNILLCISDDQSWPHASGYGSKMVSTPSFDLVAKQGVLFNNAFAASPGCSPCRAALLTGRHTWQIEHAGTHASEFPKQYVSYPDRLEKAGYFVGYTGKGWGPGNWKISGRDRNPAGPSFRGKPEPELSGYAAAFKKFLEQRPKDQPFSFWFGSSDPHRSFKKGSGLEKGKTLEQAEVPSFLPDTPEIRSDLLDYTFEVERFDRDLGQILELLEETGEADNTLVIVTSDNGMAFPRAKANCYEYGIHMPLAIRWPKKVPGGRIVDDLTGFVDITATILDAAGVTEIGDDSPISGRSFLETLISKKSGWVDETRTGVYSARERHSSSRYDNLAYPQRCLRTKQYLYIRNFRPERWPAGAPQKFGNDGKPGPEHGGYHDIDACPTLSFLIEHRDDKAIGKYFHWAVDKRPAEELYDIQKDPGCLKNLAQVKEFESTRNNLETKLIGYLKDSGDPRVINGGDIFETYKRYSAIRKFPKPE